MGIVKSLEKNTAGTVVVDHDSDIFVELMKNGQPVTFFCMNYFYNGTITAVNGTSIVLEGARLVYETGKFSDGSFADAQELGAPQWFISKAAIESFGILPKK
jgi:hypothetical protein